MPCTPVEAHTFMLAPAPACALVQHTHTHTYAHVHAHTHTRSLVPPFQVHAFVYVVDSSQSLDEARQVLWQTLKHRFAGGKPVLIFANKQDTASAKDADAVSRDLQLSELGVHMMNSLLCCQIGAVLD